MTSWMIGQIWSEKYGMPTRDIVTSKTALMNRQNRNVLKAFAILFECEPEDLIVSHDRYGLMRPVNHPKIGRKPEWNTPRAEEGLHMDLNPWQYVGQIPVIVPVDYLGKGRRSFYSGE
eukprot:UN04150